GVARLRIGPDGVHRPRLVIDLARDPQSGAVGLAPAPGATLALGDRPGDVRLGRRDVGLGALADVARIAAGVLDHHDRGAQAVEGFADLPDRVVEDAVDAGRAVAVGRDRGRAGLAGSLERVDVHVGCGRVVVHAVARPGQLEGGAVRVGIRVVAVVGGPV